MTGRPGSNGYDIQGTSATGAAQRRPLGGSTGQSRQSRRRRHLRLFVL